MCMICDDDILLASQRFSDDKYALSFKGFLKKYSKNRASLRADPDCEFFEPTGPENPDLGDVQAAGEDNSDDDNSDDDNSDDENEIYSMPFYIVCSECELRRTVQELTEEVNKLKAAAREV